MRHHVAPEHTIAELGHLPAKDQHGYSMGQFVHEYRRWDAQKECRLFSQALLFPGQWLLPYNVPVACYLDRQLYGANNVQQGKEVEETRH